MTFTATATDPPPPVDNNPPVNNNRDAADDSHLFFTQNSPITVTGWLIWIYYPENYQGPRGIPLSTAETAWYTGTPESIDAFVADPKDIDPGFTITSLSDGTITQFAQTATSCDDYDGDGESDWPCNSLIDPENPPSVYSVQIKIETTATEVSFDVYWDQNAENWDGTPATNTTYDLDADTNMYGDDPDHTNQED